MIERHHDYVLSDINVSAFGTANFVVPIDVDAPFALRCILSSGMPTLNGQPLFQLTITGADDRRYFGGNGGPLAGADSLINNSAETPFIVYPQIPFPTQITIQVSITDVSGSGISNGILVFRGCKLYQEGVVFGPQYPPQFSELNFRYAYSLAIAGPTYELLSQPLDIQSDADFVVRMCSGGWPTADTYNASATFVILRDQYGKPYSSGINASTGQPYAWVPVELLFPNLIAPYSTIYPEIYLAKNTQLLLDVMRTDSPGETTTFLPILHGSKIYVSS